MRTSGTSSCSANSSPRGFTLVELLVYLAIITLLLTFSFPRASHSEQTLRQDSHILARCMSTLHLLAMQEQAEIALIFNSTTNKISISSDHTMQPLLRSLNELCQPQPSTKILVARFAGGASSQTAKYFAQGNSTPGKVILGKGEQPTFTINQPLYGLATVTCSSMACA